MTYGLRSGKATCINRAVACLLLPNEAKDAILLGTKEKGITEVGLL
jgi:hypothetical protein